MTQANEGDGESVKDSETAPLYLTSNTFADFGKQVQLFNGEPAEPFGMFQSTGSDDDDEAEEARY